MHSGRAKIWAWTASISLHLLVLTVLAIAEFPQVTKTEKQHAIPAAKIERIKNFIESQPKILKPKVKLNQSNYSEKISLPEIILKKDISAGDTYPVELFSCGNELQRQQSQIPAGSIEFFSTSTNSRKICFVVDCSGSMKGLFGTVKKELTRSIENLQQDQYFSIIFFGDETLRIFENGRLVRASNKTKSQAVRFINTIEPKGQTNAAAAFDKLSAVCDINGSKPSAVFFLTDGFELNKINSEIFLTNTMNILATNLPKTKVNTIGFWPNEDDSNLLRQIAEMTGGRFTRIGNLSGTNVELLPDKENL